MASQVHIRLAIEVLENLEHLQYSPCFCSLRDFIPDLCHLSYFHSSLNIMSLVMSMSCFSCQRTKRLYLRRKDQLRRQLGLAVPDCSPELDQCNKLER